MLRAISDFSDLVWCTPDLGVQQKLPPFFLEKGTCLKIFTFKFVLMCNILIYICMYTSIVNFGLDSYL
jgi:hypothetical protein